MPNSIVTPSWVTKEVARILVNELHFANTINRDYDDSYVVAGAKVGYTVSARLPQRYVVNKGQALNPQAVSDQVVPITLTDQANIGIEFSTASLTMEIDNYRERYIRPAVAAIINQIDFDGLTRMTPLVAQSVGVPGVVPNLNLTYLQAGVKLSNASVPMDGRIGMLNAMMQATLVNANAAVFNPAAQISEQYRSGQFGAQALGVSRWYMDQNVYTHTVGPLGGTPTVNGANQVGASIISQAWTAAAANRLKRGDVIQFAGVFGVNPQNRVSTGQLQDFVVTADVSSDGAGAATIPISPAIITAGAYQTVTVSPASGAAITIFGSASAYASLATPQGLIYNPDFAALVMADLDLPQGVWAAERVSSKQLGISVRFIKDYNIMTDQSPARLDVLYGYAALRPELAVRIAS